MLITSASFANSMIEQLDKRYSAITDFKKFHTQNGEVWYYSPASVKLYTDEMYPKNKIKVVVTKFKNNRAAVNETHRIDCTKSTLSTVSRLFYNTQGKPLPISKQQLIAVPITLKIENVGIQNLKNTICRN